MKKIFTLFAAALVGLCAYAQMPETCPSELSFQVLNGENLAQVEVELMLKNSSENLNGFNIEVEKSNDAVQWKKVSRNYFTAKGYADVILGRMTEEELDGEDPEDLLSDMCDVKNNVKEGNLVMIELLCTLDCRFFPVLAEPTAIGKFYMDWSAKAEGDECVLLAPTEPERYSFSYTGGVEGTRAWTPDAPATITLVEQDGQVVEATTTAINTINADKAVDNRIFDLQGRELQSVPEHGIYIQNGKKYVK